MKYVLLFILLTCYLLPASAQPQSKKKGEIEPEYLKMTTYDADPTASALVLMEEGYLTYGSFSFTFTFHGRIKILNKSGLDAANIKIPYYNTSLKTDRVIAIDAAAYKIDDKGAISISKFNEKDIIDEQINEYLRQKKIFIPAVTEGSVIEYSYTIASNFFAREFDWYFQNELPVLWSEYTICLPKGVDAGTMLQDVGKVSKSPTPCTCEGETGTGFKWSAQNLSALKAEPYMSSIDDYATRLLVRMIQIVKSGYEPLIIMSDWKQVSGDLWYADYFGQRFTQPGKEIKKKAESLTANITNPKDKMIALYNYVKKQMIWDGRYSLYSSGNDTPKQIHEQRKGSSSDINLLLIAMLRSIEIDALPALCSTTENGMPVKDYPSSNQFNHVLSYVKIDTTQYLLDAITPHRPYNILSSNTTNNQVLILHPQKHTFWLTPKAYQNTKSSVYVDAKILTNQIHFAIQKNETGYDALDSRIAMAKETEKKIVEKIVNNSSLPTLVDSFKVINANDLSEQLKTKLFCTTEIDKDATFLMISHSLDNPFKTNPFKESKRHFPIDFLYPFEQTYNFVLSIPEGYTFETLPAEIKLGIDANNNLNFYCVSQKINDNKIQVNTRLILNQTQFSPQDYSRIQTFFDKVAEKLNEMIVVKKNN